MFYFVRCINIIFNSLLAQLVKYDVHTTRKIKSIHAIFITYYYFTSYLAPFPSCCGVFVDRDASSWRTLSH